MQFEFMRQLSSDSNNIVIGLVRDKAATVKAVAEELDGRPNIHIIQADITDYEALKVRNKWSQIDMWHAVSNTTSIECCRNHF